MKKTLLSFGKALRELAAAGTALIAAVEASEPAVEASEPAPEAAPVPSEPAPEPPSEAASDTMEPQQRASVSMTRSAFAQLVFPKMSRHQAGLAVAGVIVSNQHLLARLKKVGYRPNQVGYTLPQLEILCEYFKITLP